ncbi:AAA family ATPase [Pseudoscardovia radai]|uniref:AAA family ATPase n=1 Tax=Pseudoscardovia radai TaxID=987066 RepID=UPI0039966390
MKIHALAIKGIGPYKDEFFIDFGKLSRNGLFLIDGDTGAGKSTIIDAICFALFGTMTRNDGEAGKERMRSRFLDKQADADASRVELIFSENGTTYYIRRIPRCNRPKKGHPDAPESEWTSESEAVTVKQLNQQGFYSAQESAEDMTDIRKAGKALIDFARNDADATVVANGVRQANASVIPGIVGLNADQFRTVICLPQGQFESFLRAEPKDRSEMLIDIFRLGLYKGIEEALQNMEREKNAGIASSSSVLHGKVSELKGALSDLPSDDDASDNHDDSDTDDSDADDSEVEAAPAGLRDLLEEWNGVSDGSKNDQLVELPVDNVPTKRQELDGILDRIDTKLDALTTQGDAIRRKALQKRDEAQADCTVAGKLGEDLRKQKELVENQTSLAAGKTQIDEISRQVEAARNAQPVSDAHDAVSEAETAVSQKQKDLKEATDRLEAMEPKEALTKRQTEAQKAQTAVATGEAERQTCQSDLNQLDQLDQAEKELAGLQEDVASAQKTLEEAEVKLAECGDPEKIVSDYDDAKNTVALERAQQAAFDTATKVLADFDELDRLHGEEAKLGKAEKAAHAARDAAQKKYEEAELERRIAELGALEDGQPCPVCGSTEHPRTRTASDADATAAAEEAAAQLKDAKAAWERASSELNQCRGKVEALENDLRSTTRDAAQSDRDAARTALDTIEQTKKALPGLEEASQALAAAQKARDKAQNEVSVQKGKAATKQEDVAKRREASAGKNRRELTDRIAALDKQIEADREIAAGLDAIVKALDERTKAEADCRSCTDVLQLKRKDLESARAKLDRSISEHGFASLDAALTAVIDPQELSALEGQVRSYEQKVASTNDQLDAATKELRGHLAEDGGRALRLLSLDELPENLALWTAGESDSDADTEQAVTVRRTHLGSAIAAIDGEELRARLGEASQAYDDANSAYESAKSSYDDFADKRQAIDEAADDWEATRSEAWPYQRMSQLLRGNNRKGDNADKLTISAYAVQQIFTAVLDETNVILRGIHGGIFRLSLGSGAKGNAKQGLPISVYDARTNRNSDVETLSGGETFFISLALSLGLARVVQTRTSGIEMGVFFIDEGFGTLDDTCRRDVILELQKLAEQGRSIGIISHVSQLQESIGTQIKVTRGESAGGKEGDGPSRIDFQLA